MVVINVASQYPAQVLLIENDDVINAFATNGTDQSFAVRVLPWRPNRGPDLLDSKHPYPMRMLSELEDVEPVV